MIPNTIHFMWKDKNPRSDTTPSYPSRYQKYIDSWKKHHPNHEIRFWFNEDLEKLWENPEIQKYKDIYEKMQHIEKCDFSRYAIMHLYGGIYSDMNIMCFRNTDDLLDGRELVFVREPEENHNFMEYEYLVTNSIFASTKGHKFWFEFMDYINEHYWITSDNKYVMINTGPYVLARFLTKYYDDEVFIDTCYGMAFVNDERGRDVLSRECLKKFPGKHHDEFVYFSKIWKDTANWGEKVGGGVGALNAPRITLIVVGLLILFFIIGLIYAFKIMIFR